MQPILGIIEITDATTPGLSPNTLTKTRSDSGIAECRLSTLGRITNALEVPVKELFDGEYEPGRRDREKQDVRSAQSPVCSNGTPE